MILNSRWSAVIAALHRDGLPPSTFLPVARRTRPHHQHRQTAKLAPFN